MRKNKMMRIASALLVVVLLTTCAISGTFAKYVSEESGSDKARVAKWGVVIEAENNTMFTTDYKTNFGGEFVGEYTGEYSVSSANDGNREDVLAPGTSGEVASIQITGVPEVAVNVAIVADVTVSDNWLVDDDDDDATDKVFYCPVTVTVGTATICGLDYDDAGAFAAAIKKAFDDHSNEYAPNTNLEDIYADSLDIEWVWAFEGATGSKINQTDDYDTQLGDTAVGADLEIQIDLSITVTQID